MLEEPAQLLQWQQRQSEWWEAVISRIQRRLEVRGGMRGDMLLSLLLVLLLCKNGFSAR